EALALARHQPVARIDAELGQEALAERVGAESDLARHFGERRRCIAVSRIEQRAGLGDRLAEAESGLPLARLAALAGPEARLFRSLGRGVEIDVLAQRGTGRTGR